MVKKVVIHILCFCLTAVSAHAASYSFQFSGGAAYNFRTPLTIEQSGQERIKFDARYKTKPFEDSPYYDVRIGRWENNAAWELELLHHKLYLVNPPSDVMHFEISHGFNLLTLNRAWLVRGFIYRVGLGAVIAYPDNVVVRGLRKSGGYQLAGPTAQIALERRFFLTGGIFAAVEAKVTASYAHIDIEEGQSRVKNIAAHGLFGLGYVF